MFEINKFRSEINTGGVLKTNRFIVEFIPPASVGGANQVKQDMLSFRCESVQWPGLSLMTLDTPPRAGYGATELIPYAPIFEDVTLNFIVDKNAKTHKFFFDWMNSIVNLRSEGQTRLNVGANQTSAFEVGYKNNYTTSLNITMFRETGTSKDANHAAMTATLYRAFPKTLPSFELNWGSENEVLKLPVQFAYSDFYIRYF
jgi:hypothetical protein